MRTSKMIDGVVWDGKDPKKYAAGFQGQGLRKADHGGNDLRQGVRRGRQARRDDRGNGGSRPRRRQRPCGCPGRPTTAQHRWRSRPARGRVAAGIRPSHAAAADRHRRDGRHLVPRHPQGRGRLPGPVQTWNAAVVLFSDPFYSNGPNDQGIGWNVLSSLQRVGIGFGIAARDRHPARLHVGRFATLSSMVNPIISLLRPVSPLAWLPIGLLVFPEGRPGGDLDHLHLLDLADDPQHRTGRARVPRTT